MDNQIAIIGGGNLGKSIDRGLLNDGVELSLISVTRNKTELLADLAKEGITVTNDNLSAVKNSTIIFLTVKPFKAAEVLTEIKQVFDSSKHIVVSGVSGLTIHQMMEILGGDAKIARMMPNTASVINESATCYSAPNLNESDKQTVVKVLEKLGEVILINESLMNAATVLGACGIAFALRYIRAMVQAGIEIGFDAETANEIAIQTVKGAAEIIIQNHTHPEEEIDKVTTPKGCTIAGLNEMEHQGFSSALIKGVKTSFEKI